MLGFGTFYNDSEWKKSKKNRREGRERKPKRSKKKRNHPKESPDISIHAFVFDL